MVTLAVDPGTVTCGVVLYDHGAREVLWSAGAMEVAELVDHLLAPSDDTPWTGRRPTVLVERVVSQGQSGGHLLHTAEQSGRIYQAAAAAGLDVHMVRRSRVVAVLGCRKRGAPGGGSMDSRVRAAVIERVGAPGTRAEPGPTYGVRSHAWQALGLAVAYHDATARRAAEMLESL